MAQHNMHIDLAFETIKLYASEENPITPTVIGKKINKEYPDYTCERKTIKRALEELRFRYGLDSKGKWKNANIKLHYKIKERSSSTIYTDYWLEINNSSDSFEDEELMFLIDAVLFSKHISSNYSEALIKKLVRLSNNSFSTKFECYKNISHNFHTVRKDFFLNLGDINEAIHQNKKISFYLNQYGIDKELHHIDDKPIIVSPYRIITADADYYLLCRDDSSPSIKSYRIDLISNIEVLSEDYASSPEMGRVKTHPEEYLVEHRYLNSGKVVDVTLIVERGCLGDVIDAFGTGIFINQAEDTSNTLTVRTRSSEKDIINWALRCGAFAEIVEPSYLRQEIENMALLLSNTYVSENTDKRYEENIEIAKKKKWLVLSYINLNRYNSYKNLKKINVATFRHNWINDFSFLHSYSDTIVELHIERNNIKDPSILSELKKLNRLGLIYTDIKSLDFLKGLNNLESLYLREMSLESIDAVYTMKNLKSLLVNKTVDSIIDKKRLKETYGEKFRYKVDETNGLVSRHKRIC